MTKKKICGDCKWLSHCKIITGICGHNPDDIDNDKACQDYSRKWWKFWRPK